MTIFWQLSAAIYRPKEGNYKHWALYLKHKDDCLIFDVKGRHPNFRRSERQANPRNSRSYIKSIYLAEVREDDIKAFKEAVAATKVDNETSEWDCQDYVLEILDKLEAECLIVDDDDDGDDDDDEGTYKKRKEKLKSMRAEY